MTSKFAEHVLNFRASARGLGVTGALAAHFSNFMGKLPGSKASKLVAIKVDGISTPVKYRAGSSNWPVLQSIFIHDENDFPAKVHMIIVTNFYERLLLSGKCPVIIDCGANFGRASVWFTNQFPRATIYAIEPEPINFSILKENCRDYPNIVPIQAAVSDRETRVKLENASNEPWAWEIKEINTGASQPVTVRKLVSQNPNVILLIIKIDIAGFEVELFRSNVEWAQGVAVAVFESHDGMFRWRGTAHAMLSVLSSQPRDYLQYGETPSRYRTHLFRAIIRPRPLGEPYSKRDRNASKHSALDAISRPGRECSRAR